MARAIEQATKEMESILLLGLGWGGVVVVGLGGCVGRLCGKTRCSFDGEEKVREGAQDGRLLMLFRDHHP